MKHTIQADSLGRMATIIWDDKAGSVEGDHYKVHSLKAKLERIAKDGGPYETGDETRHFILPDILHNPADFLTLLGFAVGHLEPPNCILPESLQGIERTPVAQYYTLTAEQLAAGWVQ